MLELVCTTEEKIVVTVVPTTTAGAPALLDGPVLVTVLSGIGTVNMLSDTSFEVVSGDSAGDTEYLVEADADLGAGVVKISDIVKLGVVSPFATSLGLVASAPVLK